MLFHANSRRLPSEIFLSLTLPFAQSSSSTVKKEMSQNLLQWTVADVASYFSAAGFPEQAVAFRTQVSAPPQSCHRGRYTYTENHTLHPVNY